MKKKKGATAGAINYKGMKTLCYALKGNYDYELESNMTPVNGVHLSSS